VHLMAIYEVNYVAADRAGFARAVLSMLVVSVPRSRFITASRDVR
jgi:hypothetical protein